MNNSSLATYIDKSSPNYNIRRTLIQGIAIHIAMCEGDCLEISKIMHSGKEWSCNYGIGNDGQIGLYVEEKYRSWSIGDPDIDSKVVNIYVCNNTSKEPYSISDEAYASLIDLCVDICRRNFIKKLTFTGKKGSSNLIMHKWYNPKTKCPGKYLESKFSEIARTVTDKLSRPLLATSEEAEESAKKMIVVDNTTPYIATIDHDYLGVDYSLLRLCGVSGVMFYGGGLYDNWHRVKDYVNPNLSRQVKECQPSGLPFGLIVDVKAKNLQEARSELDPLYLLVSKYPPKLGVWIKIDFPSSSGTNNKILDLYYSRFVSWGLGDKCGIYADRTQLSRIKWITYYKKFALWLVDHVTTTKSLDELLVPSFFKV